MKYLLVHLILLLTSITGFSQTKYLYYFDKSLHLTDKEKAVFNGVGIVQRDTLELNIYNSLNNQLRAVQHYTDSALNVANGLFLSYHNNALPASEGSYVMGKQEGLWRLWDTVGHITDSMIYRNGKKIFELHSSYHDNGSLASSRVNDIITNRIENTYYNDKGGKISSGLEIEASFPGGEKGWTQYITRRINNNIDALARDGQSGTCRVKFIVDKKGYIASVQALTMQGTMLAQVAVDAVRYGPRWIPASQNGRPVNAFREQPVTFTVR